MRDGDVVKLARAVERSQMIATIDPGPRELENLRRDMDQLKAVIDARFEQLERQCRDRANARLPYRDD